MKYFLYLIIFTVSASYAQVYQPVTYHYNATPTNGVKIKTNLPFTPSSYMPTIIIEGYNYATSDAIGIMINYYIYSPSGVGDPSTYTFIKHNATSYGGYTPVIKLANENNKVVIFIDSKDYFQRFMVRAFSKGLSEVSTWFDGWTVVDEALTVPTYQVTVPYRNRFKNEVYVDGALSVGTIASSSNISITRPISLSNQISVQSSSVIKKGATSVTNYYSNPSTEADTFNVSTLTHYGANQGTIGANSSISTQYGFLVNNTLTGATNNYAFYGNVPNGTGKWNLYMNGLANNYIGGSLGIASISLSNVSLKISKNITGSGTSVGVWSDGQVQSDVSTAYYFRSGSNTQNTAFTVSDLYHYGAVQGTLGVNSTVNNQIGVYVGSLTGATTNIGIRTQIASAANRWNLYLDGTANNYLAGNLGIGITTPSAKLEIRNPLFGGTSQTSPLISARGVGNSFEFGHPNLAGFASTLGTESYSGKPFLCFNCEAGTNINTYRTRGIIGTIIRADLVGGLLFGRIANSNADNQSITTDFILKEGQIGIGTSNIPIDYKLAIAGNVIAERVKVKKQVNGAWPDYVFSPTYKLISLEEVEKFTKENSHLPEIPSAKEIEKDGQDLGEMNRLLLKKVEELTLYLIEQNKSIIQQNKEIDALKLKLGQLERKQK